MADLSYSEDEQLEQIKAWWKRNGTSIIAGVVLGLAIVGGYNYWRSYQKSQAESASGMYEKMMIEYAGGKADEAIKTATALIDQYKSTPYAGNAGLFLARIQYDKKDSNAAAKQLRWVIENATEPAIAHVARLRLGRLLLDEGKGAEVAAVLKVEDYGGFESAYRELEGDVALANGDAARARDAYTRALEVLPADSVYQSILKLKLDHAMSRVKS